MSAPVTPTSASTPTMSRPPVPAPVPAPPRPRSKSNVRPTGRGRASTHSELNAGFGSGVALGGVGMGLGLSLFPPDGRPKSRGAGSDTGSVLSKGKSKKTLVVSGLALDDDVGPRAIRAWCEVRLCAFFL